MKKEKYPGTRFLKKRDSNSEGPIQNLIPKDTILLLSAKLANIYYNDSTLKNKILGADRNPEQVFPEEVLRSILDTGQIDELRINMKPFE